MPSMDTGVVQKWVESRGFGFIKPNNGGEDLFVHANDITGENRSLEEGEEVEFEVAENRGKTTAINVTGPAGSLSYPLPCPITL